MRSTRLAAVLIVVVLLVVAQRLGVFHQLGDPARLKETLVTIGPWGYAAFLVSCTLIQPAGVPGTVFVLAASLIWPWPIAFALSMVGTCSASAAGFSFARFVARDWVSRRIPARFRAYDAALEKRGFATVFVLRTFFWMQPLLHAFFGVSRVRFSTHLGASAAAYLLPVFLISYFGQRVFDTLRAAPPAVWIGAGAAIAVLAALAWAARRRAGRALSA